MDGAPATDVRPSCRFRLGGAGQVEMRTGTSRPKMVSTLESGQDVGGVGRDRGRSADETTAKLAHDRVLLRACGSHGDLTAHRPVTASVHRRQETPQRRQIRKVANGTTDGRTPRLVFTPDVVHGLARNRDPTARFAGDLDHATRIRMSLRSSGSGQVRARRPRRVVSPRPSTRFLVSGSDSN
jgi:hypothetical protein